MAPPLQAKDFSLLEAASYGRLDQVKRFLANGAHMNTRDCNGNTPLMCSIREGHVLTALLLINEPSVNVNEVNLNDETALMLALSSKSRRIAEALLARSDMKMNNAQNRSGHTTLMLAVIYDMATVVETLISCSEVEVNVQSHSLRGDSHIHGNGYRQDRNRCGNSDTAWISRRQHYGYSRNGYSRNVHGFEQYVQDLNVYDLQDIISVEQLPHLHPA